MTISNERGSALIITLMLLLILTAIGIYAISISTTEMSIALQSKTGTALLNTADSGANYGIDQVPNLLANYTDNLADQSYASVSSNMRQDMTFKAGFGSNYGFSDFEVTSTGYPPPAAISTTRTVEAVVNYGPVPLGTMY